MKKCYNCKELKNKSDFSLEPRNRDGLRSYCKKCAAYKTRQYRKTLSPKQREQTYKDLQQYQKNTRKEVLYTYGNKCACCGETTQEFLSIDHINGGGNKHRKKVGRGNNFYLWLKKNKYPKDNYRVLCYNCNCSLGFNGYCPHTKTFDQM